MKNTNKSINRRFGSHQQNQVKRFFIVDDDQYFNSILNAYVHKIGEEINIPVETSNYTNGTDCLSNIHHDPDFVILDFYLDENNDITATGYDVLEKINKYNQDIKVIVISQMHEWENFKEEFTQSGATGFFKKDNDLYNNLKEIVEQNHLDVV